MSSGNLHASELGRTDSDGNIPTLVTRQAASGLLFASDEHKRGALEPGFSPSGQGGLGDHVRRVGSHGMQLHSGAYRV